MSKKRSRRNKLLDRCLLPLSQAWRGIDRTAFGKSLVATLLLFTVLAANGRHACGADHPNFLFVIADDCTYHDIGCYGGQAHTPNIDRLAGQGVRMTRCFQAAPMCSPTRHNIYTGQYPVKTGAYPNHTFAKVGTRSVVHYLKPLGYRVALSGKRHIAPDSVFPFEYTGKKNPDMIAISQLMGECADSGTPFCLFACSNEPHTPWNRGDPSRYSPDNVKLPPYVVDTPLVRESFCRYLAEVTYFDDQVGQLLELLDEHQLSDETVVMVVSEQGNSLPFAKWTCYDAGLQSAMVVRWPGKIEAGSQRDALVEYVDILPTFLEIAGTEAPSTLDGRSFLSVLLGKSKEHKQFVFGEMTTNGIINGTDCYPIRSVRSKNHKLIWNLNHPAKFTNACTRSKEFQSMVAAANQGNAKAAALVERYQSRPEYELYDITSDPHELNNLAEEPGLDGVKQELLAELKRWMNAQGDLGIQTELAAPQHQARALRREGKR